MTASRATRRRQGTGRASAAEAPSGAGARGPERLAQLCAALGHPLRIRLVTFLTDRPHGGAYVCDVAAHLRRAQSTVSHHLGVLVAAGLLASEQHGAWTWYRVVPECVADLREHLSVFIPSAVLLAGAAAR